MNRPVAVVTEIAAPYRIPVFNALANLLDGALHVFFISERESRRDWEVPAREIRFRYDVLGGIQFAIPYRGDYQPVYLAPPLLPRLARADFSTVVVGGWNHIESLWSLLYTQLWRRRLVLWSETPLLGHVPTRPLRTAWKRAVITAADAYVVPGPSAAHYLESHRADPSRIHLAPNAVDVEFWSTRPSESGSHRREGRGFVLLFVGRLVRNKGLDIALEAYASSRLSRHAILLVAGDGPERAKLERVAPDGVRFLGSRSRDDLRQLYHEADLLVFPSRYDPWGFVVNEAACASLGAIASDGAGATRDLIRDGENGLVVLAGDVLSLRRAFDRVVDEPELPRRLGEKALEISRTHTPTACALGLREAIG